METNSTQTNLKNTLLTLQSYTRELISKWYLYALVGTVFLAINYYRAHQIPVTYKAQVSLMLNSDGGSLTGLMQLAGQFGLGGNSEIKTEKIVELLSSKRMVYDALLQKVNINNQNDMLFNHFLTFFELKTDASNNEINNFRFENDKLNSFTKQEYAVAQAIYNEITMYMLTASAGKSGIIRANCESISENFSKEFLETLVKTLRNFYANKTVEQQSRAYQIISERCDSLERILYGTEYELANWIDNNRNALRAGSLPAKQGIKREQYKREAEILNVMYVEAIKNRELAHINLLLNTPSVQIIDYPTYPIKPTYPNRLLMYIAAIIAAFIAVSIGLIFHKMVRELFT